METVNTIEEQLSEVLDNILGLLLLEGSYEVEEEEVGFMVSIDTKDAGRLIGARGESLEGLQLLVNQIMSRKMGQFVLSEAKPKVGEAGGSTLSRAEGFKRVILDVSGWRKQKEEELISRAKDLGKQVLETGKEMELEPMSPWQRRVVHMVIQELGGLSSESMGEGRDRHIVIKQTVQKTQKDSDNSEDQTV